MILIKKWANITTIKKGKILYLYFKVFLTSGNSFNYRIPRDKIAHLLGVKTENLILTGMFKNTQSYEVLKELFRNQTRISGMIKDGVIKLNDIFSKHINEKLSGFKNNCSINIFNNMFVCKHNREKVIQQGKNPRNCNYIICSSLDDGTLLELDLIINNKYSLPVSNRLFNDEIEAQESFKELLQNQVSKLKEANKLLQTQNTELNNSLKQTQDDLNNVNQEYQKTLTFINTRSV